MLPLARAYNPSSWAIATARGCGDICFLLASQHYGSVPVCIHTCIHVPLSPYCTAYSRVWMLTRTSRNDHHRKNIQMIHTFAWGSVRLAGLKHPCKQKRKNILFLLFLPCCQHINELSLPYIWKSAGRTIVSLGVLSLHILVKNLYLFYCHKIY